MWLSESLAAEMAAAMSVGGKPGGQVGEPLRLGRAERGPEGRQAHASRVHLHRRPWRVLAAGVVVNGGAVALVVLVLPGVKESTGHPVLGYLALGAIFGVINAFVKPVIQFAALPALLGSLGLVVIVVDVITFWLLDALTPLLHTGGLFAVLAAGVVLGVLSYVLDNVLGLVPPIRQERARRGFAA
jgi:putative membrane protein